MLFDGVMTNHKVAKQIPVQLKIIMSYELSKNRIRAQILE